MSSVKKIESFQTSDGEVFEFECEALFHQSELDFDEWYMEHQIFGNCNGSKVELSEIKEWLDENRKMVRKYLNRKP